MATDWGRGTVFLHVGTPKSGTSFVQGSLLANAEALRTDGVFCAARRQREMFRAAAEMRQQYQRINKSPDELAGSWAELCARARSFPGTTVLSNELLGGATRQQAGQMLAGLHGLQVHVVLTARDLARTFPAAWQQAVKHGVWRTFSEHQRLVTDGAANRDTAEHFWRAHDVPSVLDRWGSHLPAANVHLVTVPPAGSDPLVLWQRFCSVIGVEAVRYPAALDRANPSLGVVEVEVLRRVGRYVRERDEGRRLTRLVNRYYARELLRRYESPLPRTPETMLPMFEDITGEWRREIDAAGYDVVGDLDDLRPRHTDEVFVDPDGVPPGEALERAAQTIADLLVEVDRLQSAARDTRRAGKKAEKTPKSRGGPHLLASVVRRRTLSRARSKP